MDLDPYLSGFLVDFTSSDQKWCLKGTVFRSNATAPFKVHLFTSPPIQSPYPIQQQHLLVEFQRRSGDSATFCQFFRGICLTLQSKSHQYFFPETLVVHSSPSVPLQIKNSGFMAPAHASSSMTTRSVTPSQASAASTFSRNSQNIAAAASTVSSLLAMIQCPFSDVVLEGLRGLVRCSETPLNAFQMLATRHFLDAINHHLLETTPTPLLCFGSVSPATSSPSAASGFSLSNHEETRHYAVSLLHNILKAIPPAGQFS